jgi:hypothetical protein
MAAKFRRAEMSYSNETEIEQMKSICEQLGYSVSDVLRDAMVARHELDWPVPLWRQDSASVTPGALARREQRAMDRAERAKKPTKKKSKK